jgi:hypothetical protein
VLLKLAQKSRNFEMTSRAETRSNFLIAGAIGSSPRFFFIYGHSQVHREQLPATLMRQLRQQCMVLFGRHPASAL